MGKNAQRRRTVKMLTRVAGVEGKPNPSGLNRQARRYLARKK